MLFEFLGALAGAAVETAKEKVGDVKEEYEKDYDWYSERASDWDNERLKDEYKKACDYNNLGRKMALYKIMQERGMINN